MCSSESLENTDYFFSRVQEEHKNVIKHIEMQSEKRYKM